MMKRLYFHSSNHEYMRELRHNRLFQPTHTYTRNEIEGISPYEIGKIQVDCNSFHILLGNLKSDNCPWCDSITVAKSKIDERPDMGAINTMALWMQCIKCRSRGPMLVFPINFNLTDEAKENLISLVKEKYSRRIPWDRNFPHNSTQDN